MVRKVVCDMIDWPGNYALTVAVDSSSHWSGRHTFGLVLSFSDKAHRRYHMLIGIYNL
jgi:hypothetical protein